MSNSPVKISPINRDVLRYFAIICMTLDHIAWFFVDYGSVAGRVMHFFGRMTAPIMCYFLTEGVKYTKNIKKYVLRLLVFGVIAEVPFLLLRQYEANMMFTLALGILAIVVLQNENLKPVLKVLSIFAILFLSAFCDWKYYAILWIIGFYYYKENKLKRVLYFVAVWFFYVAETFRSNLLETTTFTPKTIFLTTNVFGSLVGLAILSLYNGKKGRYKFSKWFFYAYYPAHLLIIFIVFYFVHS